MTSAVLMTHNFFLVVYSDHGSKLYFLDDLPRKKHFLVDPSQNNTKKNTQKGPRKHQ